MMTSSIPFGPLDNCTIIAQNPIRISQAPILHVLELCRAVSSGFRVIGYRASEEGVTTSAFSGTTCSCPVSSW